MYQRDHYIHVTTYLDPAIHLGLSYRSFTIPILTAAAILAATAALVQISSHTARILFPGLFSAGACLLLGQGVNTTSFGSLHSLLGFI